MLEICVSGNSAFQNVWNSSSKSFDVCFISVCSIVNHFVLFGYCCLIVFWWNFNLLMRERASHFAVKNRRRALHLRLLVSVVILCSFIVVTVIPVVLDSVSDAFWQSFLRVPNALLAWFCNVLVCAFLLRTMFSIPLTLEIIHGVAVFSVSAVWSCELYNLARHIRSAIAGGAGVHLALADVGLVIRMAVILVYLCSIVLEICFEPSRKLSSRPIDASARPGLSESLRSEDADLLTPAVSGEERAALVPLGHGPDLSSLLSKLFFCWVNPLMLRGYRGQLTDIAALFTLPTALQPHVLYVAFLGAQERFVNKYGSMHRLFFLVRTLHSCFGWQFYALGLLKLISDICAFAGPVLLHQLVQFLQDVDAPIGSGYWIAAGMFLAAAVNAVCSLHFSYWMGRIKLKLRGTLVAVVHHKVLSVPLSEQAKLPSGRIINAMSVDVDSILNYCDSFHAFWSIPLQIALSFYLLYEQVQLAFLAGVAVAIILVPINRWIAKSIGTFSAAMMQWKDARVKLMTEILHGIRLIKYSALEAVFAEKIFRIRQRELAALSGRKYLDALCVYLWASAPVVIALATFTFYTLMGYELTAAKVFTAIALFNMLISPLNVLPWSINGLVEAWVSAKRVQEFLELEDGNLENYYDYEPCHSHPNSAFCCHGAQFSWKSVCRSNNSVLQISPTLPKVNVVIPMGSLTGVMGPTGAGKSSLLLSLLGELYRGRNPVYSWSYVAQYPVAYFSQEPWLLSGTVRSNICFGQPFNLQRYATVLDVCCLNNDLKMMPNGDQTELGEQGVTLSGGQRARIALARTVYLDTEVYLLDDPLSAVDVPVADLLFHRCIQEFLKEKTVILVTHRVGYMVDVDQVVRMRAGAIDSVGSPSAMDPSCFGTTEVGSRGKGGSLPEGEGGDRFRDVDMDFSGLGDEVVLVQSEDQLSGFVGWNVYVVYLRAIGVCLTICILISLTLMQGSRNGTDWFLSYWVSAVSANASTGGNCSAADFLDAFPKHFLAISEYLSPYALLVSQQGRIHEVSGSGTAFDDDSGGNSFGSMIFSKRDWKFYLTIYGIVAGSNTFFTLVRAFLFAYGGIVAAKRLHERLLASVLGAGGRFYDTTPGGRIVNRLSSDVYSVDESLPFQANILLASLFGIAGTVVMTCYGLPWFAVVLLPLALVYYAIQKYYRYTTCDLKRLSSVSLSPLYCHFTDTLNGATTIRALKANERFIEKNYEVLSASQRANFAVLACSQWFAARLQLLGVLMVTSVALIAVLQHQYSSVDPGLVGLALSYALAITGLLNAGVTSFTETEKELVAVERIHHYIDAIPVEDGIPGASKGAPGAAGQAGLGHLSVVDPIWPSGGSIVFSNVTVRYADDLPFALRGVSFRVNPGERIGIVGRTGSGKSSLFQALFRYVNLAGGVVLIDGVDIATVSLNRLRSSLAIVPQMPTLFSGTLRENIDLESKFDDAELTKLVDLCGLKPLVGRLSGLGGVIGESGRTLSVGEKQLICLARVILRRAKVICIDEATAHVDHVTDQLMQKTIRSCCADATVLTIAHRVETIVDVDRVLVMDGGKLVEMGSPSELLAQPGSLFSAMVRKPR